MAKSTMNGLAKLHSPLNTTTTSTTNLNLIFEKKIIDLLYMELVEKLEEKKTELEKEKKSETKGKLSLG